MPPEKNFFSGIFSVVIRCRSNADLELLLLLGFLWQWHLVRIKNKQTCLLWVGKESQLSCSTVNTRAAPKVVYVFFVLTVFCRFFNSIADIVKKLRITSASCSLYFLHGIKAGTEDGPVLLAQVPNQYSGSTLSCPRASYLIKRC